MRKIAATYVLVPGSVPLKNSILILDGQGLVLEIINTHGKLEEQAGVEYYSGCLVPGLNTAQFEKLKIRQLQLPDATLPDLFKIEGLIAETTPGACLITKMDLKNLKLLPGSKIKQLV